MNQTQQSTGPKYRQVERRLIDEIVSGQLPNGSFLPSEERMADTFGVGRSTLRQALQLVRNQGYLETSRGRRTMVRWRSGDHLRRLVWLGIGNPMDMNPVLAATYNAFIQLAEEHRVHVGYWMLENENAENWFVRNARNIDGVLLAVANRNPLSSPLTRKLTEIKNCVTLLERTDFNLGAIVRSDEYAAGELVGDALVRRGYRRILILAVSPGLNISPFHERIEGCVHALLTAKQSDLEFQVIASDRDEDFNNPGLVLERCQVAAGRWDAIFCITDHYALSCLEALRTAGIRVPEQVGLIAVDGIDAGAKSDPPLTSVAHDFDAMVQTAFRILAGLQPPGRVLCPPHLLERASLRHNIIQNTENGKGKGK